MAATITKDGIAAAISALKIKDPNTLKARYLAMLQKAYKGSDPGEVAGIPTEAVVAELWGATSPEDIKRRRKNLSSLRSSINRELKEAWEAGANPEGIVISASNNFVISDEAKDKIVETLADRLGVDSLGKLDEAISGIQALKSLLAGDGLQALKESGKLDEVKETFQELASHLGLEVVEPGEEAGNDIGGGGLEPDGEAEILEIDENLDELQEIEQETELSPDDSIQETDGDLETEENFEESAEQEPELIIEDEPDEITEILETGDQNLDELQEIEQEIEPSPDDSIQETDGDSDGYPELLEDDDEEILEHIDGDLEEELLEPGAGDEPEEDDTAIEELLEEVEEAGSGGDAEDGLDGAGPLIEGGVAPEVEISIQEANRRQREFETFLIQKDQELNIHVEVPEGVYPLGGAAFGTVAPRRRMEFGGFKIKKYPVTNALFSAFVEQTGYLTVAERVGYSTVFEPRIQRVTDPSGRLLRFSVRPYPVSRKVEGACWHQPEGPGSNVYNRRHHPVVHVCTEDALAFAAWVGCRLPSEDEWEAAARTKRGLLFPWGNQWAGGRANTETAQIGNTSPVTMFSEYANPFGLVDCLGNVWELTSSLDRTGLQVVAKGGSWLSGAEISLISRTTVPLRSTSNILGFRCIVI